MNSTVKSSKLLVVNPARPRAICRTDGQPSLVREAVHDDDSRCAKNVTLVKAKTYYHD